MTGDNYDDFDIEESSESDSWEDSDTSTEEGFSEFVHEVFGRNDIVGYYADEEHSETLYDHVDYSIEEIVECLRKYLRYFTLEERDIIYMNLIAGKAQVDIAPLFGKTQPAVCNDVKRIKDEISLIRSVQGANEEVLEFLMKDGNGLSYMYRDVLLTFFYSMSITKTAQIIGINAMLCRTRIESALKKVHELGQEKVEGYFQTILKEMNKIKKELSDDIAKKPVAKWDYTSGYVSQSFNFEEEEK